MTPYPWQQAQYNALVRRWNDFAHRSFPEGWAGTVVDGIELVLFESDMYGLLSKYIDQRKFTPGGVELLRRHQEDLRRILPSLSGEALDYFKAWDELVATSLRLIDDHGG